MVHKTLFFQVILGVFLSITLLLLIFFERDDEKGAPRDSKENVGIEDNFQFEEKTFVQEALITPFFRPEKSKNKSPHIPAGYLRRWGDKTPDYAEFSDLLGQGLAEIRDTLPVVLESQSVKKQADVSSLPLPPRLSEREIHNRIWPPEYVEGLRRIEAHLIHEGFVAEEEQNAFATDKNMYDFLLVLTEYAYGEGWITSEERKNFTRGITEVFPETIGKEKAMLMRTGTFGALLPKDQHFAASKSYRDTIRDFFDGLSYVFSLIEPANAAWITKGDCYKDDNPLFFPPGPNRSAFCCNCGFLCTPKGCTFLKDCRVLGKVNICNVPLGCLNFVCRKWPNAIWDKVTRDCGCG